MFSALLSFNNFLTSKTSSGVFTNDCAIKSIPLFIPNTISSISCSDIAGRSTIDPGILTFFLVPTSPPIDTIHSISVSPTFSTLNSTVPSAIYINDPFSTIFAMFLYDICIIFSSHNSISFVVIITFSLSFNITGSLYFPILISGPFVSSIIPIGTSNFLFISCM